MRDVEAGMSKQLRHALHALARERTIRWAHLRDVPLGAAGRDHELSVAQMRSNAPEGA